MEGLNELDSISVVHCTLDSQPLNMSGMVKEKALGTFKSQHDFNRQSQTFKILKYLKIYWEIVKICLLRNQTIISQDYQLISFMLSNNYLLRLFNNKLIYYQFELVDYDRITRAGKKKFRRLKSRIQFLTLAIFPEINRMGYFCKQTNYPIHKCILIPNTCKALPGVARPLPDSLRMISKDAIVFGHIGNVGPDHYIKEFLRIVDLTTRPDVYYLMVGRYSEAIRTLLGKVKNPNFIVLDEVPHDQLKAIYPVIDYGLILYKAVDKNFEYCAPNKLYEYWSYGIPVISHKLPGLISVVNKIFLGMTIDFQKNELLPSITDLMDQPKPNRIIIKQWFDDFLSIDLYVKQLVVRFQSL